MIIVHGFRMLLLEREVFPALYSLAFLFSVDFTLEDNANRPDLKDIQPEKQIWTHLGCGA